MYQASIRDKKKHKKFHHVRSDNYDLNPMYEEYAYVKKLLGNCRVHLITNSGKEAIGVIRGTLRKFTNRVIIEAGDIVVVSKREYQDSKVDIVHKYNADQVMNLIAENKLCETLSNAYQFKTTDAFGGTDKAVEDSYINFGEISDEDSDYEEENNGIIKGFKTKNLNGKYDVEASDEDNDI